jgi:predicted dehydrogenase
MAEIIRPETVSWGLIGVGDIVRKRVGDALRRASGSSLTAVAAAHPQRAQAYAREFHVPRWHADWKTLVRDPAVTAIYIASPVAFHCEQTLAAARAGKHVLCEKPLAMNARQGTAMVKACRRAGVLLGTAYYRRYYPLVMRIKEVIATGEIGQPVLAQLNAFSSFEPGPDHPRRWLIDKKLSGGGPLKDFGCHRVELLLHLFGAAKSAIHWQGNARWPRGVEDTAVVGLRFADSVFALLSVSHAIAEPADTFDLYGSAGSLRVPSLNGDQLLVKKGGMEREECHPALNHRHLPLIQDFVGAVREGRPFAVDGETGVAVDRITDKVYAGPRAWAHSKEKE